MPGRNAMRGWASPSSGGSASSRTKNRRLKQVVADLTLDKQMLQEVLQKNVRPGRRRAIAHELIGAYRVSARRACGVVGCHRATFYYRAQRRDVTPLRMCLRELAAARPRFGYRHLHICCAGRAGGSTRRRRTGCTEANLSRLTQLRDSDGYRLPPDIVVRLRHAGL